MGWTGKQIVFALVMVITGSINTLSTKWADQMYAKGSDGVSREFNHPFVQAVCMFLGEGLCFVAFYVFYFIYSRQGTAEEKALTMGNRNFNPFIFFPAAMCDMIGTSVMYVGLTLTYASSFQMFRGSVIVFVAILSIIFLRRKIGWFQWLGILAVIIGLAVVGLSDFLFPDSSSSDSKSTNQVILGDVLIIAAQVVTAIQMVYEEKFVSSKDIPALLAVGWEGIFGFVVLGLLLIPFYYIPLPSFMVSGDNGVNAHNVLEDFPDAMVQLGNNGLIILAVLGNVISIAFFNFAGISVTKELSATTRMILDSVRTLVIWVFSLAVLWQKFQYLQIIGFILLIFGMATYNGLIPYNRLCNRGSSRENLISSQPSES